MKDLITPNKDELGKLKEAVEFNSDEEAYWEEITKHRDSEVNEGDYQGKIEFYKQELNNINGRFGNRVAVERKLKYVIGHAYEWLGTYILEGHDPEERAKMFEKAALWYQSADEVVGFLTNYALRQSEASAGAARFRKEAGLEDKVTDWFRQRANKLLESFFGKNNFIVIGREIPEHIKQMADVKIDSVVKAYFFGNHSQDYKWN